MESTDGPADEPTDGAAIESLVDRYLEAKSKGRRTGNYRSLASAALGRWTSWLDTQGVRLLDDVDDDVMRSYAQDLRSDVRDGEFEASTANTYYAAVRACLTWGVEDGILVENPAAAARATKELPEDSTEPSRQVWDPDDVQALLKYTDQCVDDALQEGDLADARGPIRDRALVSVLAFSGVRGAEVFRNSGDDRRGRQGLRWSNVDLDEGTLYVLGKSQDWEDTQLPPQAQAHLQRHQQAQKPASLNWPVFPTGHVHSLQEAAREQLADRDWDPDAIEELLEEESIDDVLREHDVVPPAITVRGARSRMQHLCDQAEIDVDGEYLKPHGARRGLGDTLYRRSAELAQSALRHSSVQTTHEAYSNIGASDTADAVGGVLDDVFGPDDQSDEKERE